MQVRLVTATWKVQQNFYQDDTKTSRKFRPPEVESVKMDASQNQLEACEEVWVAIRPS